MLTRRQFLIGAGATAAMAAGGAAAGAVELGAAGRRRVLHRLGLTGSPDHSVPASGTKLESGRLRSAHMPQPVGWTVSVPAGPVSGVVYCLHGRGNDHRYAFDAIHLHDVVAAAGVALMVAAVDGRPDSYWHKRADGSDAMAMLLEEFVPMVEARAGTGKRALLGWSMGGYGALLAAETAPDRFAAVTAASPALWTSAAATAPGAFDNAEDYRTHDVFAGVDRLRTMTVRIDCGADDPFVSASRRFVAALPSPPQSSFGPGFHDQGYWRTVAPHQITTISAAFAAA